MRILATNPPYNIRELCEATFDLDGMRPVWTYGNTLYNPHGGIIDAPLYAHEQTHSVQQGDSPAQWWTRYLEEPEFRFEQELAAYRAQYVSYQEVVKDRNALNRILHGLASDLSSSLYGGLCTHAKAKRCITGLDNE